MLKLVDCKPFTTESARQLKRQDAQIAPVRRRDYALEMTVACTARRAEDCADAEPFPVLLDTGFNGYAVISYWHYERLCKEPIPFAELPEVTTTRFFDGSEMADLRFWGGKLWLFPEGERPDIQEPVPFVPGQGIVIIPRGANDACIGLSAMQALNARVQIDFSREVFSVFVPEKTIRSH